MRAGDRHLAFAIPPPTVCVAKWQTIGTFLDARAVRFTTGPPLLTAERLGPHPGLPPREGWRGCLTRSSSSRRTSSSAAPRRRTRSRALNVHNDWWAHEHAAGTNAVEAFGAACDHYHRYADDFRLLRFLGQPAHRLSIEWSRLEPREGCIDTTAVEALPPGLRVATASTTSSRG